VAANRDGKAHPLDCQTAKHKRNAPSLVGKKRQRGQRKKESGGHHQESGVLHICFPYRSSNEES
jgi:hypothetical protein